MTQEMGESLIYSWLRHVKGCQIVQINWQLSPTWKYDFANAAEKTNITYATIGLRLTKKILLIGLSKTYKIKTI